MTNLEQQNVENSVDVSVDVSVENPEAVDLSDTMALLDANAESDADFSGPIGGIWDKIFANKQESNKGEPENDRVANAVKNVKGEVTDFLDAASSTVKKGFESLKENLAMNLTITELENVLEGLGEYTAVLSDIIKLNKELGHTVSPAFLALERQTTMYLNSLKQLYNLLKDPRTANTVNRDQILKMAKEVSDLMTANLVPVQSEYIGLLEESVKKQTNRAQKAEQRVVAAKRQAAAANQRAEEAERAAQQNPKAPEDNTRVPRQGGINGTGTTIDR